MSSIKDFDHLRIPLDDIKRATNNFSDENIIGKGGFGRVYKGQLSHLEGLVMAAIKRLDRQLGQGRVHEFLKEMFLLSLYKHENIVSLIGFCYEDDEMILVYEFVTHGSLDRYLSNTNLTWLRRLRICLGAARGLCYLYNPPGTQQRVLHRYIKSSNILLDQNWQPKITDLGLSKIGTVGYVDPAYHEMGLLTKHVYSFGVVLFEVLCGRSAYATDDDKRFLAPIARLHYREGKLNKMIDPVLRKQMNPDSLKAFSAIAYQCLERDRYDRPQMIQIAETLEHVVELQWEFEKALPRQQVHLLLQGLDHLRIPLDDIKLATDNFSDENVIGKGGFRRVYKGQLSHLEGLVMVAIMRLDRQLGQGSIEFWKEMVLLSGYKHVNIVSLIGFCDEYDEKILVYEFVTHGSLESYLSYTNLAWLKRLQICLGAARGFNYLHNDRRVLHRDIKSSRILLDKNWQAKIAGFGLSKMGPMNDTSNVTNLADYHDPTFFRTGFLAKESDVYSFGVILFEVLCGRPAAYTPKDDNIQLLGRLAYEEGKLNQMIDPILWKQMNPDSLKAFSAIAYQCLDTHPNERPTMTKIVETLEKALALQRKFEKALAFTRKFEELAFRQDCLRIPLDDIKLATDNFSDENIIGRVYKGQLSHLKLGLVMVAIKRLDRQFGQGSVEFWKEILMLSHYKHENIVSLIGFCDEDDEKILVYKFVTYGSLDNYLSYPNFTWLKRLQICLGAARGFNYLHNDRRVPHRDIKSSRILLDKNWQAKVAGFGLSKMGPMNDTSNVTNLAGYRDPKELDVYSFGVVLFEVLCGRPAAYTPKDDNILLLGRLAYEEGKLNQMIDPILWKQMNPDSLKVFSAIAYQCLEQDRHDRPTMTKIVETLEKALALQRKFEELAFRQVRATEEDDYYKPHRPYLSIFCNTPCWKFEKAQARQRKFEELAFRQVRATEEDDYYKTNNLEHMKISFEDIHSATNGFHNGHVLGRGGFGVVYEAELFHVDARQSMVEPFGYPRRKCKVAVKRLDNRYGQGKTEFLKEVEVLSRLNHHNVVSLLGFCYENNEMILVYEHASHGSLDKFIQNTQTLYSLTWAQRLQICLDMAHGLSYIHNLGIIHRDIKSSNILLGGNWEGMIGDFGLSRISKHADSKLSVTNVAGTPAYADPKYVRTGNLTKQSDIYSFGVVLLEVFCGRLAVFPTLGDEPEYLVHMAKRHFDRKQLYQIIDPRLREELEKSCPLPDNKNILDSVNTFAEITYKCLHSNQDHHLTMADVVKELKKASVFNLTGVEILSLEAIKSATNCFSKERVIGGGASGKVYTGELSLSKRPTLVAVKRLHRVGSYGEGEFFKGVAMLSRYIHENVIPLRGFCEEGNEKIIILEHAINKSLDKHVDKSTLTWGLRLKISIGAAKGLHYIHTCVEPQHSVHGDIKSSNILLDHDWKASISDLIISKFSAGRPTKETDVYSFGVVLFEILSGRLATEKVEKYPQHTLGQIINVDGRESNPGEQDKDEKPVAIIFDGIKEQTDAKSIDTFSEIAYQCLQKGEDKRPTMVQVIEALEKAFGIHDEWEWAKKLPRDYEKIIKKSKYEGTIRKKDLYYLLSSGIPLDKGKVWFSLSKDGKVNEMISATKFSYKNLRSLKWRSTKKSRFPKVAKMSDPSNLNIQIQIKTQFLSPGIIYGAYLVFKFCDPSMFSNEPYVNLKYKTASGNLNAYILERRDDGWMMIELCRLSNHNQIIDFEVLLKSFCGHSCGSGPIFVEGIEFRAIDNVDHEDSVQRVLNTDSNKDWEQQWPSDLQEIMKSSQYDVPTLSKQELYKILSDGVLIDNGEKIFSLSRVNGKKCHMLPAKAVIYKASNVKCSNCQPSASSRFAEVVELQSHQVFHIKCNIETQMLSRDTAYAGYLVFKLPENCMGLKCPVKARDLFHKNNKETRIFYFKSPSPVNLYRDKRVPQQREDGWMEVIVWEFISHNEHHGHDDLPMDLKLVCLEGTMFGLIVCGIEFRPT